MRRALLYCALISLAAVSTTACGGSASTMPAGTYAPYANATAAASYEPYASQAPYAPPAASAAAGAEPYHPRFTPRPQETPWATRRPQSTPYPDVAFPSLDTNPYVRTVTDPVSTFGLDVDTASYTVARKFISDGNHPDPDSIRPEEWVNYFDQGYPAPEIGAFALYADGGATPFLSSREVLLRIGVKAREPSRHREPVALTFVIDVSGSMAMDGRLELVKHSLALLVEQLRHEDRVSIVAFTTDARVVLGPTSGADRRTILGAIAELRPLDSTNLNEGLRLGYDLATRQMIEGGINRVVLATDGVANVGQVDAASILHNVGADRAAGVQLVAVGVGMGNYNDALLEELADQGDGFYAYVDTEDEARRIFVDDLTSTIVTVALDAKAQVDFEPGSVAGYRLIGYEDRGIPDSEFRNPDAKGGAIGAGHEVTALYALVLRPEAWAGDRLATVSLRWTDPDTKRATEIARDIDRGDLTSDFGRTSSHFKLDATVAAAAEVLRGSPWIEGYGIDDVRAVAWIIASDLPADSEARDFLVLLDQVARLDHSNDW
jgi:Ca-activated chloride channel family protein